MKPLRKDLFEAAIWNYSGELEPAQEGAQHPSREKWSFAHYLEMIYNNSLLTISAIGDAVTKDVIDTFKPYKARYALRRDLLQPWTGFKNFLKGLAGLILTPIMLAIDLWASLTVSLYHHNGAGRSPQNFFFRLMLSPLVFAASMAMNLLRLAESLITLLQGLSQMVTAPLTWVLKVPLRNLLTAIEGAPKIESNIGMRRVIHELEDNESCSMDIYRELHRKFRKQRERSQETDILTENSSFETLEKQYKAQQEGTLNTTLSGELDDFQKARLTYHSLFLPLKITSPPPPSVVIQQQSQREGIFDLN